VIGVLVAIPWALAGSQGDRRLTRAEFASQEKSLLQYMNGGPVRVAPSPAICLDAEIPESYRNKLHEWWEGKGNCERTYTPDLASMVSPATSGIIRQFFPEQDRGILDTLSKLQAQMESPSIPVIKKLEIQSTAWELLAGIYLNFDEKSPAKEKLLKIKSRANALMCSTLLSDSEIHALPDNLSSFIPGYKPEILERILRHDPEVLEIDHSGGLHREFSRNRFSTRVFITVDQKEQTRFHDMLMASPRIELIGFPWAARKPMRGTSQDLRSLGDDFDGVHAILVLYFNVLDKNLRPVATNLVAGWQEYKITGRMDQSKPAIENISKIQFTSIEYERNLALDDPRPFTYHVVDDRAMSNPASVFETSPVYPDVPVTTHRGKCLGCHTDAVGSFFTMRPLKVVVTPPLTRPLAAVEEEKEFKKFTNFLGGCSTSISTSEGNRLLDKAQRPGND